MTCINKLNCDSCKTLLESKNKHLELEVSVIGPRKQIVNTFLKKKKAEPATIKR